MANSHFKLLSNKISAWYKDDFISELQLDLKKSVDRDDDLYSMIVNMSNSNGKKFDINLLLKYYMINQLIGDNYNQNTRLKLIDTPNPEIKKDKNGNYYIQTSDVLIKKDNIQQVNEDGSYIVTEKRHNNSYSILKTYNIENQLISMKIVDSFGNINPNKLIVAELIGLRKEYKKKYKHSGYSGKSNDVVANLLNMFSTPIETGYYIDSHCLFYRWRSSARSFVRMFNREMVSPLLVDIEFRDNGTVLRKEYTGIVA